MSELEDITVLRSDLQAVVEVLNALYSQHFAQDLVEQYRKLDNRNRRSPLTLAIETQRQKLLSYLDYVDDTAQEEAEGDVSA